MVEVAQEEGLALQGADVEEEEGPTLQVAEVTQEEEGLVHYPGEEVAQEREVVVDLQVQG